MSLVSAIIVAAGQGVRMAAPQPKQYLALAGIPLVGHCLRIFCDVDDITEIFLVVPKGDIGFCRTNILRPLGFEKRVQLVAGGKKRQDSVYNGLLAAGDQADRIVLIHDGVRPFFTAGLVAECIAGAKECGACLPGLPVAETIKHVNNEGLVKNTLERKGAWLAQTPQAFQYRLILKAHEQARTEQYYGTDDADLVQRIGAPVKMILGSRLNIKITTPEDLRLGELFSRNT